MNLNNHPKLTLLAFLAASIISSSIWAQDITDRLNGIALDMIAAKELPGMSVAVQIGDSLVLSQAYGFSDLESKTPATPDTVYRIGSITKQFTAAAVLKLIGSGQLDLSDSITKRVPDYYIEDSMITLHQLLTHTSGVSEYVGLLDERIRLRSSAKQIVDLFASQPLDFPPGESWNYSNSGYYLLGLAIESASGLGYAEFVEHELAQPLELQDTHYCDDSMLVENRANGYKSESGQFLNADPIDMSVPFSAGAMCSTARDLVTWTHALFHENVVSQQLIERMITPVEISGSTYGYGIHIEELNEKLRYSHDGGINGFSAFLAYYPKQEVIISVLTNLQESPVEEISLELASEIFKTPTE